MTGEELVRELKTFGSFDFHRQRSFVQQHEQAVVALLQEHFRRRKYITFLDIYEYFRFEHTFSLDLQVAKDVERAYLSLNEPVLLT